MRGSIELGPFTEGVNLVDPLSKLSPNELARCLNMRTGVRGDFYKRPGHNTYGTAPAKVNGDNLVNLIVRYYKSDGSKKLIAAAGGKLKYGNDITGAWTAIDINGVDANMAISDLCDWVVYKNRLYITDGIAVQRYNGTDDIYAGHYAYGAPTLAQAVGGSLTLNGTYKYAVASVMGNLGEGPIGSVATITLSGANNRVNLSGMTAAPAKFEETAKRIYRTKAGGTLFYFLAEIASGTTTYQDDLADNSLNTEYIPVHAPPVTAKYVIMGHDERAYWFGMSGTDASLVQVSDIRFPDRILDDDGFFTVANNDGDILTGAGLVPGGIVFFKRNSTWLQRAFGFGLINIQPREKRGSGVGTIAPFSIVSTPIGLIFLSQRGEIYKFDGTNLEEIGRKIASEFKGMTSSVMSRIVACYHDYRYIITYDYRGMKGYNWRTLEYDTRIGKWEGPHENYDLYNPSYYSVWDSQLDKGELYWGEARSLSGSYVYGRNEFSELDNGHKFLSIAQTGALAGMGKLGEVKSYKIFIHGEISEDVTLTFTHIDEVDRRTSVKLKTPVAALDNTAVYDVNTYDDGSVYGGTTSQVLEGSLDPCRSRMPIFEISDGGTATSLKMNIFQLIAESLDLK